jgi:hypothetical protein
MWQANYIIHMAAKPRWSSGKTGRSLAKCLIYHFHTLGPNVSPSATTFLTAVWFMSRVPCEVIRVPHQSGIEAPGSWTQKKRMMAQMARPTSRAAEVM